MLASTLLALALEPALGPTLPAGSNVHLQRAKLAVEERLKASDWPAAKKAALLLPKYTIRVAWDDSKVSPLSRPEFNAARDTAIATWRQALQAKITVAPRGAAADVSVSFVPVLPKKEGSAVPLGAAIFFSESPAEPRVELVIGLQRGNPATPIHPANVANEVAHALGQYFGMETNPTPGSAMGRVDFNATRNLPFMPFDLALATRIQVAVNKVRKAVDGRLPLTPAVPKIFVDPKAFDFGRIRQGDALDFSLQVTNPGNAPLAIRLTPDCGCVLSARSGQIEAGSTQVLKAHLDTSQMGGDMRHHILVETNDPERPRFAVPLLAVVQPSFRLLWPQGSLATSEGRGARIDAYLIVADGFDLRPTDVEVRGLEGKATAAPWTGLLADPAIGEGPAPRKGYKLSIEVTGAVPFGRYPCSLVVRTNNAKIPQIKRSFIVQRGIVASPEQVYFGELARAPRAQSFVLTRPSKPFKVLRVTSDLASVTARPRAVRPGEVRIDVTYSGHEDTGPLTGSLTITTDDSAQPTIVVPIRGSVK